MQAFVMWLLSRYTHVYTLLVIILTSVLMSPPIMFAKESLSVMPGKPIAPEFTLPDTTKNYHTLSKYRGNVVIINFWATWCLPCRAELPSMNRAWHVLKGKGVEMIAINVGDESQSVLAFMDDYPITFTVLLDIKGNVVKQWPLRGLPTSFVIDTEGRIVYNVIGSRKWDDKNILNTITSVLNTGKLLLE